MHAAWIISVHLVGAWLFETSPVLSLQGASRSKNTISQVVSHELKIAKHSFPVRLLYHSSNPTSPPLPQLFSTPNPTQCTVFRDRRPPSLQPDEEICRNEKEREKRRGGKKSAKWSGHRYMTHIPSHSPNPSPTMLRLSSKDVFTMFYHPIFWSVLQGPVN